MFMHWGHLVAVECSPGDLEMNYSHHPPTCLSPFMLPWSCHFLTDWLCSLWRDGALNLVSSFSYFLWSKWLPIDAIEFADYVTLRFGPVKTGLRGFIARDTLEIATNKISVLQDLRHMQILVHTTKSSHRLIRSMNFHPKRWVHTCSAKYSPVMFVVYWYGASKIYTISKTDYKRGERGLSGS